MVLKPLKIGPPWYVLLDYFTTRPSFKHRQAKRTRGVWFLVVLAPCIASILYKVIDFCFVLFFGVSFLCDAMYTCKHSFTLNEEFM